LGLAKQFVINDLNAPSGRLWNEIVHRIEVLAAGYKR
jgi:hypothetical protein